MRSHAIEDSIAGGDGIAAGAQRRYRSHRRTSFSFRLILVNGPPAVGKSTLARRYLADHPLALVVEIDDFRMAMGGWVEHEESKLQARVLALTLVRAHVDAGHDVVIPQYLGRPGFIDQLEVVAEEGQRGLITSSFTTGSTLTAIG